MAVRAGEKGFGATDDKQGAGQQSVNKRGKVASRPGQVSPKQLDKQAEARAQAEEQAREEAAYRQSMEPNPRAELPTVSRQAPPPP